MERTSWIRLVLNVSLMVRRNWRLHYFNELVIVGNQEEIGHQICANCGIVRGYDRYIAAVIFIIKQMDNQDACCSFEALNLSPLQLNELSSSSIKFLLQGDLKYRHPVELSLDMP